MLAGTRKSSRYAPVVIFYSQCQPTAKLHHNRPRQWFCGQGSPVSPLTAPRQPEKAASSNNPEPASSAASSSEVAATVALNSVRISG